MNDRAMGARVAVTLAALAAMAAGQSHAQAEQEVPPPGGKPKDFVLPDKITERLDNGLEITAVPFGSVPKVSLMVVIDAGNVNEGAQTWLADLTGDFLLEGTAGRNAEAIAREAAAMGGQVSVNVGEDQTSISGDVLAEYAPQMATLLADIVRRPAFPESELERLRRDRLRQLSVARTQPDQMALAAFRDALYGDHPYGNLFPEEKQLRQYSLNDIKDFYDKNFGAARTAVFVAGQFDRDATLGAVREAFGDWKRGPEPLVNLPQTPDGKVVVDVIDRPDASQSNVYLGLPTVSPGDDDWIPLQVTNTLLGGFFSSRITSNIREDKGYTYSPYSTLSTRYHDAYWVEVAAVTTDVTGPAITEIFREIRTLQQTPPTADELAGVQNYTAGVFVLQNSTRNGIINVLSYLDYQGLPDSYLDKYVSNVFAVTPDQVSRMARDYLRSDDMTLVVVGDRGKVAEQVAQWMSRPE